MLIHIPRTAQKAGNWRGGQIHEIFCTPPHANFPTGDYHLWAGTATIEHSSDYSYFPGTERLHVLLAGDGLRLHFQQPEEAVTLHTQEWLIFSGERPLRAEVLGAPVFAFNLVYRQGMRSGAVLVRLTDAPHLHAIETPTTALHTEIVYVVAGRTTVRGAGADLTLAQGDTLLWELRGPATQHLIFQSETAKTLLLLAFVFPVGPHARLGTSGDENR